MEFKENSFDAVVSFELVEHLTKEEGLRLIANMERWARKKVIISTPAGYVPQDAVGHNPHQRHMSGWDKAELEELGFKVYGACGWRALRDHEGKMKFKPETLWATTSSLTSVVLYHFPNFSFGLFCVKALN